MKSHEQAIENGQTYFFDIEEPYIIEVFLQNQKRRVLKEATNLLVERHSIKNVVDHIQTDFYIKNNIADHLNNFKVIEFEDDLEKISDLVGDACLETIDTILTLNSERMYPDDKVQVFNDCFLEVHKRWDGNNPAQAIKQIASLAFDNYRLDIRYDEEDKEAWEKSFKIWGRYFTEAKINSQQNQINVSNVSTQTTEVNGEDIVTQQSISYDNSSCVKTEWLTVEAGIKKDLKDLYDALIEHKEFDVSFDIKIQYK